MSSGGGGGDATKNATTPSPAFATADLCDVFVKSPTRLQTAGSGSGTLNDYGGATSFCGRIETVRCFESNPLVRRTLSEPGHGRVLVVDGGGSRRVAILGDQLATLAYENNWAGVVVNGCIRDSKVIGGISVGVKALGTHPVKSIKDFEGEKGGRVSFAGLEFVPGDWLYADEDGIVISEKELVVGESKL
eukprot:CAMPEP_0172507766 /NCGR_PEP_ID=MMETSP1066-20121228/206354_1 /TAXON_ID=671091 /ORGANISM="Coscinodiscus wailesii, Strain CCMP2513" /LENGTH=189 /DNA_ID=CAMNT_0013285439 /DNA_START=222 /DNA_END=791 /DNA_ORIENTATION=+